MEPWTCPRLWRRDSDTVDTVAAWGLCRPKFSRTVVVDHPQRRTQPEYICRSETDGRGDLGGCDLQSNAIESGMELRDEVMKGYGKAAKHKRGRIKYLIQFG